MATSVSALSVTALPSASGATYAASPTAYTVNFTTSSTGQLPGGDTITLTAPTGTAFPATAADYYVNGVEAASATNSTSNVVNIVTVATENIGTSTPVTVVASPVASTSVTGTGQTFSVSTTTDTVADNTVISVVAASGTAVATGAITVTPAVGSDTNVSYTVPFTPHTALPSTSSNTITVTAPSGTVFPSASSDYNLNSTTPLTLQSGGGTDSVVLAVPSGTGVPASLQTLNVSGVTNPSVTSASGAVELLTVATSQDTQASPSVPYTLSQNGTSVTSPSLTVSPTTSGSVAAYTVGFTTSSSGALSPTSSPAGSITLNAPSGTVFPSTASSYAVTAGGTTAQPLSVTYGTGPSTNIVTITPTQPIAVSSPVSIAISGVTNPSPGTYTNFTVYTSSDQNSVALPSYTITGTSVTPGSVSPSPATAAAAATYTVGFTTSSSGAIPAGGTITFNAPAGTVFLAGQEYSVQGTLTTGTLGSTSNIVTISVPASIGNGASVTVKAFNVTNPAAGTYTNFMVSTSADQTPAAESSYVINAAPTEVTPGTFSVSQTAGGYTPTTYTVNFTTSSNATNGVNLPAGDTITVSGATGTTFPSTKSDYTVNGIAVTATPIVGTNTVTFDSPVALGPSSGVSVVIVGVTNPPASTVQKISESTQTDTTTATETNTITMTAAGTSVSGVSVGLSTPNTAGALDTYAVGFTTTHTVPAGDTVTITGPSGTSFPSASSDYTFTTVNGTSGGTTQPATGGVTISNGGTTATITLPTSLVAYVAGDPQVITVGNVTNPSTAGYYTATVATQTDTVPAASNAYAVGSPSTSISTPSVTVSPTGKGTPAQYTVAFNTSSTGTLSGNGTPSTITITFPATTVLTTTPVATVNGVSVTPSVTSETVTVPVPTGMVIGDSSPVSVVFASGITNPTTAGTYHLVVNTSSDSVLVDSSNYTITSSNAPDVTGVSPTSGPTAGGTSVTISGANFTGTTQVLFGNTLASSYQVVSPTTITAVSPAESAGTVNITVTSPNGTSATSSSDQFTYAAPAFTSETPVRIYDSRNTSPLVPGSPRTIQVTGLANVPSNATAVAVNVTAVQPTGVGNLRVYPAGSSTPNVSTVNYIPGQSVANYDVVGLTGGQITLQTFGSTVNVAVDVTGYFVGTSAYTALATPQRVLDTRPGSGMNQADLGPLMPGTAYPVQVTGLDGIPSSATSVAVNVTAILPNSVGNLRVFPAGSTAPNASTINYNPNNTVANFDIVKPVNGFINVQTFGSDVNVAVDVVGYSTSLTTQVPVRILDTRPSSQIGSISGPVAPGTVESVQVAGLGGVPSNAAAVLMNVTAVGPSGVGNLRVFPDATAAPGASNINYIPGQDSANFVIVQLPADGKVDFESFGSSANVLFDVVGYVPAGV